MDVRVHLREFWKLPDSISPRFVWSIPGLTETLRTSVLKRLKRLKLLWSKTALGRPPSSRWRCILQEDEHPLLDQASCFCRKRILLVDIRHTCNVCLVYVYINSIESLNMYILHCMCMCVCVCLRVCVGRNKDASIAIVYAFEYIICTYVDVHMYMCFC